jgi:hypothetical protein
LKRRQVIAFFQKLPPCLVGIEACASSHHWSRELRGLGHSVRLMPPAYVKPYVKRQKNDMADPEAICEAVTRANMQFVPTKTPEQQSGLMLHRTRHLFIRQQTSVSKWQPLPRLRTGMALHALGESVSAFRHAAASLSSCRPQNAPAASAESARGIWTRNRVEDVGRPTPSQAVVSMAEPLKVGLVGNVAADEFAAELLGGVHDDEAAGGRVNNKLSWLGNGTDQPPDKLDRLDVRMNCAVDLFRPAARDAVVSPRFHRGNWRLLHHR